MPRWHTSSLPSTLILVATLSGCGGDASDQQTAVPPAADPRFATADALITYYNQLTYETELIDARATLELYYAENDLQRQMVRVITESVPSIDLEQAMWEQFGQGFNPAAPRSPLTSNREATVITERNGPRVLAREVDAQGSVNTIHLVQVGTRWWLSGYTLEYDDEFTDAIADFDAYEQFLRDLGLVASSVASRIRRGEFSSAEKAREAVGTEIMARQRPTGQ